MPHTLADDGDWHIAAFGDTCPRVPSNIHRQEYRQVQLFSYFLQQMIHPMKFVGVLFPIILVPFCDDRQKVFRFIYRVFVNNLLHTSVPFDEKLLPRLSSAIGKDAVLQVFLPQISHVNERHTPCIETE